MNDLRRRFGRRLERTLADYRRRLAEATPGVALLASRRRFARRQVEQSARLNGRLAKGPAPEVDIRVDAALPALAWRGVLEAGRLTFTVGPRVHHFADGRGFFEGVWAGDFGDPRSLVGSHVYGSGVLIDGDEVRIVPPTHALEQLFICRDVSTGRLVVANSLAHCVTAVGGWARPAFRRHLEASLHEGLYRQTMAGAIEYDPYGFTVDSVEFHTVIVNDFAMAANGHIEFCQPFIGRNFRSFGQYKTYLSATIEAIVGNGSHSARGQETLTPVVTVSRGYDSPAVAALVREKGCTDALVLDYAVGGRDDSGGEIAERLGLCVRQRLHPLGTAIETLRVQYDEAVAGIAGEFLATAGIGDDILFAAWEEDLPHRLLFTGTWGDSIWASSGDVPPGLPVRIWFSKSLNEFRLRVGFAHVPAPMIGGFFPRSILAISRSEQMRPFRVDSTYDRPIARRLAEEAGIERGTFALAKAAANPDPLNRGALWMDAMNRIISERYAGSAPAASD